MVQSEYWCSPDTSAKKSYNSWMSSVYFYDPLKNWYQGGVRVSEIYCVTVEGGSEVIVADHYKGRRRGLKDVDFSVSLRLNVPFYKREIQKAVLG